METENTQKWFLIQCYYTMTKFKIRFHFNASAFVEYIFTFKNIKRWIESRIFDVQISSNNSAGNWTSCTKLFLDLNIEFCTLLKGNITSIIIAIFTWNISNYVYLSTIFQRYILFIELYFLFFTPFIDTFKYKILVFL